MPKIPVIDFSLFSMDVQAWHNVVQQIYQACHEIGFLYLQNPGISPELIEEVFTQSKYFFNLPLTVKQQLAWSDEFSNQGYVGIERESLNPGTPGDLKEAFNIGNTSSIALTKEPCIQAFYQACTHVANQVLQAFALGLQLPEDFFTIRHNEQNHTLRLLHYPPLQQLPKPGQVRAGEHSDYGSITLLFQDQVGGLEVQTAFGEWIAAPAIPGTVLINTGDLMQRWTNDVFVSTKHWVMIPTDDRLNQSRYSVAFFCHPNDDTEIACLESCQQQRSPIYPPIFAGEYLLSRLQATYY
ncbi:isopenicillin N synthase family oxygenase [Aetokthonos hydrillicola Thurmond2011]|jgi:isopenicillin N synthase-like dioxygenase|uniref:Isopenicillin N synthase family oxygenase n=1 Tax=Aetokthonos hydrillicola Thurmond2011 TaxID=2712845 RepID=A0AAP5IAS0_9CYAN|nr:2-oxoglutarate and iron-dependent oxygenase domain-containing protein [Aetokthonos hydrillicola]MBO3458501.1 isopenicillin N synthase family oxygenase [Aetokthonos hydrillicola CCALA 1050]MBW4586172.1 isopenicillin N synthase family oxygenase [Aetokthonos hydrillicola CCALA 1050]MDR9897779.1 isopenicillin N synthase family oxygenase [Aetokthonos hydrillicola Thurmond2011]